MLMQDSEDETWPSKFGSHRCFLPHSSGMPISAISTGRRAWSGAGILKRYRDTPTNPCTHTGQAPDENAPLQNNDETQRRDAGTISNKHLRMKKQMKTKRSVRHPTALDIQQRAETFRKQHSTLPLMALAI
ncbi:hypothetical protein AMECASPLE_021146 [Ameca splendens]|uniref:Uncharacterized protein n=1 Tax=Ameca splendens TaxID=208324 RepID=A0ABV0XGI3_9TELE